MTIIFAVYHKPDYEDSTLIAAYSTREKAEQRLQKEAKEYRYEQSSASHGCYVSPGPCFDILYIEPIAVDKEQ